MDQRADQLDEERIKADIEDTRAEMGQTLNEIQERLSPEHLMDQVKETVREATIGKVERVMETVNEKISNVTEPAMEALGNAGEKLKQTGSSLTSTVRRNPIPFALVGLGVGMLIVSRVRNADGPTTRMRNYRSDRELGYGMATPRSASMSRQYGGGSPGCALSATTLVSACCSHLHSNAHTQWRSRMRRVVYSAAMSLDGYIAGTKGESD